MKCTSDADHLGIFANNISRPKYISQFNAMLTKFDAIPTKSAETTAVQLSSTDKYPS
jgi:hypothetical protein